MRPGRCWFAAAFCLAAAAGPVFSEDDAAAKAVALVRQLNADAVAERDKAGEALVKLGPAALSSIPQLDDKSLTAEQRKRLEKVVAKIYETKVKSEAAGSFVNIPAGAIALSDVLREIEKQSGNAVKDQREEFNQEVTNPTLTWPGGKLQFWDAMDKACALSGVGMYHFAGEHAISIRQGEPESKRAATNGAFRFTAKGVSIERDYAKPSGEATLRMEAIFEPKLRPVQVELDTSTLKVLDDRKREVALSMQKTYTFQVDEGAHHFEMVFKLASPERDAKKLASVEGEIAVVLPASTETFEFPDWTAEKSKEKTSPGLRVQVKGAKDEGDGLWSFRVVTEALKPDESKETESFLSPDQEVWLQKADGARLAPNAGKNTKEDEGRSAVEYLVSNAPGKMEDYRVVVRIPAGLTRVPVKFAFKDLELP